MKKLFIWLLSVILSMGCFLPHIVFAQTNNEGETQIDNSAY